LIVSSAGQDRQKEGKEEKAYLLSGLDEAGNLAALAEHGLGSGVVDAFVGLEMLEEISTKE
jgi:hypothetical protein